MSVLKIKNDKGKWENVKTIIGPRGKDGAPGPAGRGVPAGGRPGDVLVKNSDAEGDTIWATPSKGASIWTGPYEDYIANKEAIDAEYDIVLTDDPIPTVTEDIKYTLPQYVDPNNTSLTLATVDLGAGNELLMEITQGNFVMGDHGMDNPFKTTTRIINNSMQSRTYKGFTIFRCDEFGNEIGPAYSMTGASIDINPGQDCTIYHEIDMIEDLGGSFIKASITTEVR